MNSFRLFKPDYAAEEALLAKRQRFLICSLSRGGSLRAPLAATLTSLSQAARTSGTRAGPWVWVQREPWTDRRGDNEPMPRFLRAKHYPEHVAAMIHLIRYRY